MKSALHSVDDFLRGHGVFAVEAPATGRLVRLVLFVILFGVFYGIVMSSFTGLAPGRWHQLLYVGLKVPLLLLVSFALCLPSFFVINAVLGLRDDFAQALRAVVATQSCVTIVLAGLAPVTAFFYFCTSDYSTAVLFNGIIFLVASVTAQRVVQRYYAPLVQKTQKHRAMIYLWFVLYVFVSIQMAWVLRPFIGDPNQPVAFFRQEPWSNAYVVILNLLFRQMR